MSAPDSEKDYYGILHATEDASQDEIERSYKRLAKQHHPDRGGHAEEMKAINEAYRVLGNEATRRAYDSRHQRSPEVLSVAEPSLSRPVALLPDTILGRLIGALFVLLGGLVFLFLVRIYYLRFMWPIFLVAVFLVIYGVWKVHAVMIFARKSFAPSHPDTFYGMREFIIRDLNRFWITFGQPSVFDADDRRTGRQH
jgi:hypothetical protein